MELQIQNGAKQLNIQFGSENAAQEMINAIYRCIDGEAKCITHMGNDENIILTSEYLKSSLISYTSDIINPKLTTGEAESYKQKKI